MTKDSRDAKIEQQDLLIRCLTDDMVELKRELETTKQERDIALKEAILAKAKEELADVSFNEYQYDLMENNLKLKEINNQLYNFRNDTHALIYTSERNMPDPYWENMAMLLVMGIIGYIFETPTIAKKHKNLTTLQGFANLCNRNCVSGLPGERSLSKMNNMMEKHNEQMKKIGKRSWAYEQFQKASSTPDRTFQTILSTVFSKLLIFDSEEIQTMVSKDGFDFENLGKKPTVLFVEVSDTDRSMDVLSNLFFTQLINALCSYADEKCDGSLPIPVQFILDDFSTNVKIIGFENMISNIRSRNISKEAIEKYDLSESFFLNLFGYIKNSFEYAFRMKYITTNEFLYVDKDKLLALIGVKPPKSSDERILTNSQQKSLYEAIKSHEKHNPDYVADLALELAMQTGMRVGEIAALHWNDLHDGYIHIDYSEHRIDYDDHIELVVGEPKNMKHRKFPFNPIIEDIFIRIKALGRDGDFVFTNKDGERHTASSISCAAIKRGNECGIEKVSVHRIRRTVVSELRKKYSIKLVSELMGHLEETDEEYYNYDNSEESEKIDASNSLCSNVLTFQGL